MIECQKYSMVADDVQDTSCSGGELVLLVEMGAEVITPERAQQSQFVPDPITL